MPLETGTRLGPYEILEALASGTSGEIYRAQDMKLGRHVAIKVLRSEVAEDEETLARFSREARALASLNNPSVAAIYGQEEYDGVRFLVLELIRGQTLKERLRESGPLPLREALNVILQVAEALVASHAKGIIHRDLNPANIKITPDGKTKLVDFGLAKSEGSPPEDSLIGTVQTLRTKLGMVMGTPPYMSPEQTVGQPPDKRTDIWAFGCVVYEALVGKRAFSGSSVPDVWEAIQTRDPDWSLLPAETPEALRELMRRCLCKDLAGRVADMGEARSLLQELIQQPPQTQEQISAAPSKPEVAAPEATAAPPNNDGMPTQPGDAPKGDGAPAPAPISAPIPGARIGLIILGALLSLLAISAVYYFLFAGK